MKHETNTRKIKLSVKFDKKKLTCLLNHGEMEFEVLCEDEEKHKLSMDMKVENREGRYSSQIQDNK